MTPPPWRLRRVLPLPTVAIEWRAPTSGASVLTAN